MKKINVTEIREEVRRRAGMTYQVGGRLPANFGTHPEFVEIAGVKVKVLTAAEAKALRPKSYRTPHRVMVWDEVCSKWMYAGKFEQHQRMIHKRKGTMEQLTVAELIVELQKYRGDLPVFAMVESSPDWPIWRVIGYGNGVSVEFEK